MSETRYDRLADEFDAMRLDVLAAAICCEHAATLPTISEGEKVMWQVTAARLRGILEKYPQKNIPKVTA